MAPRAGKTKFSGRFTESSSAPFSISVSQLSASTSVQRGDAVALLRQVLQPLAEEGVHAQAVADHFRRRRIHADHVLPAPADVAMRGLDLARVVVQRAGTRTDRARRSPGRACVGQAQFGGVAVLLDHVQLQCPGRRRCRIRSSRAAGRPARTGASGARDSPRTAPSASRIGSASGCARCGRRAASWADPTRANRTRGSIDAWPRQA